MESKFYAYAIKLIVKFNTTQLDFKRTEDIISKFMDKFIDDDLIEKRILLWNSIKSNIKEELYRVSFDEIRNLPISNQEHVYIYLEREKNYSKQS